MAFVQVALKEDIEKGKGKTVKVNDKEIAIFNLNDEFYALDNTCPHRGGPLGEGEIEDSKVTCPWHGWTFDVKTGQNIFNPMIKQKGYNIKLEDNKILVDVD